MKALTVHINGETNKEDLVSLLTPLLSTQPKEYTNPNSPDNWKPVMALEEKAFKEGLEKEVPKEIIDFCEWCIDNGVSITLSRKYITNSCEAAVKARNEILGLELKTHNEIKMIVFDLLQENLGPGLKNAPIELKYKKVQVGVVFEADDDLLKNAGGHLDEKKILKYLCQCTGNKYAKLVKAVDKVHGRQEPISFMKNNPDGILVIDHQVVDKDIRRSNNAGGLGTYTVIFDNFKHALEMAAKNYQVFVAKNLVEKENSLKGIARCIMPGFGWGDMIENARKHSEEIQIG